MISTNVMSFVKKIVKAGDEEGGGGGGGPSGVGTSGSSVGGRTICKLRQTVATGMKEIRDKAVPPSTLPKSSPPPPRGDLRHLTDEEKTILQQVWKKEAEFEKASLKQKSKPVTPVPVSPQRLRKAGPKSCRICRKSMTADEKYYTCAECGQGVCDDCASYRKDPSENEEGWKCSFCRRRQDRLGADLSASGMRRVPSHQKMIGTVDPDRRSSSEEGHADSIEILDPQQKSPPPSERLRRESSKTSSTENISNTISKSQTESISDLRKITDVTRKDSLTKSMPKTSSPCSSSTQENSKAGKHPILHHEASQVSATHSSQIQELNDRKGQNISGTTCVSGRQDHFGQQATNPKSLHPISQSTPAIKQEHVPSHVASGRYDTQRVNASSRQPSQSSAKPTTIQGTSSTRHDNVAHSRQSASPTNKQTAATDKSERKDSTRSSRPGSPAPEYLQSAKTRNEPKSSPGKSKMGAYPTDRGPGLSQSSSSYSKMDMEKINKHPSLEIIPSKERRPSVESQKSLRISSQTQPTSPASMTGARQYHLRMSSASESSVEDKSPPDDNGEIQRRNRMRRSRFQRQKTFVDERDSDGRSGVEDWPSAGTNEDSSFDSSSAFESFDNDGVEPKHKHHAASYGMRSAQLISSEACSFQRRRSSDSSDISDISSEMIGYVERSVSGYRSDHLAHSRRHAAMKSSSLRRTPLINRNIGSDFDSGEKRYSPTASIDLSAVDDRIVVRNRMEKSISVDDPEMMMSRIAPRRPEYMDEKRRHLIQDYSHDLPRNYVANAYQASGGDAYAFQGQQQTWTRSARSLELCMEMTENRRSSVADGEGIKIVIDDVDAERKGYRNPVNEARPSSRRSSQEKAVADKLVDWNEAIDWAYEEEFDSTSRSLCISSRHKASSASDVSGEVEYHQSIGGRRRLPLIPDQAYNGEVGVQIWYGPEREELVVTIVAAKGLRRRKGSIGALPKVYAKLRMLPCSGFRPIKTVVIEDSTNPEWNKICVFPGITVDEVMEKVLEVSVWDIDQGEDIKTSMGIVNILLRRVDLKNILEWYPLTNRQLSLLNNPHKASSTGMLVSTPAHDIARRILSRGSQREILQSQSLTDDGPGECNDTEENLGMVKSTSMDSPLMHPEDGWDQNISDDGERSEPVMNQSPPFIFIPDHVQHRSSRRIYPLTLQDSLPEMYCSDMEQCDWPKNVMHDRRCVNSDTEAVNEMMCRPRARNSVIRRRAMRANRMDLTARSVVLGDINTEDERSMETDDTDLPQNVSFSSSTKLKGPNNCSVSHSKCPLGNQKLGDIKLGLVLRKGQLNVEVIKARGIRLSANGNAPDTYVKTYLKNGEGKGLKRKTSVVRQSSEPKFHQTLKYTLADQRHKILCAMLWERHKRFEHNQAIGMVELNLDKIKLNQPFTRWYSLLPLASVDSESVGST